MKRNRVGAEQYPNSQISQEGITMTGRKQGRTRNMAFRMLAVGLASLLVLVLAGPVSTVLGGPSHSSNGQPGHNGGVHFPVPFIIGITALALGDVKDCQSGAVIPPEKLTAEFFFADGAHPPFQFNQLKKIIIKAEGYQPKEITQFMTMQFTLGFLKLVFIIPLEASICLQPACNNPQIVIKWGAGSGSPQFPVAGTGNVNREVFAGEESLQYEVIANDMDPDKPAPRDYLSLFARDLATPLPPGAEWLPEMSLPFSKEESGLFKWTPQFSDARAEPYVVRFKTRDVCPGAEATAEIHITVKTRLPNLVPINVTAVKLGGGHWRVKFQVHNRGSVGAKATQVRIYGIKVASTPGGDPVGREKTESFGTGALGPFETTGEIFSDFANGDYDVTITVDPENKVEEVDEGDNVVRLQLRS